MRSTDHCEQDEDIIEAKCSPQMRSSEDPEASEAYQEREQHDIDNHILMASGNRINEIRLWPGGSDRLGRNLHLVTRTV